MTLMGHGKVAVITLLCMGMLSGCDNDRARQMKESHERAVYESLWAQNDIQQQRGGYASADLGLGISNEGMKNLVSLLKGIVIVPTKPPKDLEDVSVKINDFKLISRSGRTELELQVSISSPSNNLTLDATVAGDLLFMPPAAGADITGDQLAFRVQLKDVNPSLSWYFLRLRAPTALREYITYRLAEQLEKDLVLKIATAHLEDLTLGLDGVQLVKENGKEFEVQVGYSSPKFKMPLVVRYSEFVMAESGFWLFGRYAADAPYVPKPAPKISTEKMESETARLTNAIQAATTGLHFTSGNSALLVNNQLLIKVTNQLNARPINERTVTFKAISHNGKFFEQKWRDDILGDGGLYVELDGPDPDVVSGQATLINFSPAWSEKGLGYSATADVKATAKVHAHFDPLVGGGIGKRATLDGSASPALSGTISFSIRPYGNVPVLVAENHLNCAKFPITVMDHGDLKVGVTLSHILGGGGPSLSPALIGTAQKIKADQFLKGGKEVKVKSPKRFVSIAYVPAAVINDSKGLRIELSASAAWSDSDGSAEAAKIKEIEELVKRDSDNRSEAECGKPDSIKVHLAGVEFGKNNEFVKVINFLVDGAKKGADGIKNYLNTAQKNLINPPADSPIAKPLHAPLDTLKCGGKTLLGQEC